MALNHPTLLALLTAFFMGTARADVFVITSSADKDRPRIPAEGDTGVETWHLRHLRESDGRMTEVARIKASLGPAMSFPDHTTAVEWDWRGLKIWHDRGPVHGNSETPSDSLAFWRIQNTPPFIRRFAAETPAGYVQATNSIEWLHFAVAVEKDGTDRAYLGGVGYSDPPPRFEPFMVTLQEGKICQPQPFVLPKDLPGSRACYFTHFPDSQAKVIPEGTKRIKVACLVGRDGFTPVDPVRHPIDNVRELPYDLWPEGWKQPKGYKYSGVDIAGDPDTCAFFRVGCATGTIGDPFITTYIRYDGNQCHPFEFSSKWVNDGHLGTYHSTGYMTFSHWPKPEHLFINLKTGNNWEVTLPEGAHCRGIIRDVLWYEIKGVLRSLAFDTGETKTHWKRPRRTVKSQDPDTPDEEVPDESIIALMNAQVDPTTLTKAKALAGLSEAGLKHVEWLMPDPPPTPWERCADFCSHPRQATGLGLLLAGASLFLLLRWRRRKSDRSG